MLLTCHRGYVDCLLASSQHNLYDIYLLLCVHYFSAHIGILVLKCFQFHFEYSLAVLATLSFSIPHINNTDSDWEFREPQSEGINCLSNTSSTADIDKFAVWSVALYCMKCPYMSSFVNNLHVKKVLNILIYIQQDSMLHSLFYLENALHVPGGITRNM